MTDSATLEKKPSKVKLGLAGLAGFALIGIAAASAANLGIESNNELGAGTSVTASCQPTGGTDIEVNFTGLSYNQATEGFDVETVQLSSVDAACEDLNYQVVLADATGAELDSATGTVVLTTGGELDITMPNAADAADVEAVSVVIYD